MSDPKFTSHQLELSDGLITSSNSNENEPSDQIKRAMHLEAGFACVCRSNVYQTHSTVAESSAAKRQVMDCEQTNKIWRNLQRQAKMGLKKESGNWWNEIAAEIEAGNSKSTFRLTCDTVEVPNCRQ